MVPLGLSQALVPGKSAAAEEDQVPLHHQASSNWKVRWCFGSFLLLSTSFAFKFFCLQVLRASMGAIHQNSKKLQDSIPHIAARLFLTKWELLTCSRSKGVEWRLRWCYRLLPVYLLGSLKLAINSITTDTALANKVQHCAKSLRSDLNWYESAVLPLRQGRESVFRERKDHNARVSSDE